MKGKEQIEEKKGAEMRGEQQTEERNGIAEKKGIEMREKEQTAEKKGIEMREKEQTAEKKGIEMREKEQTEERKSAAGKEAAYMGRENKKLKLYMYFIRNYKKNTAAAALGLILTFLLITAVLSLVHTNYKISNIQAKTEFSPSDCYIEGLSWRQIQSLRSDKDIVKLCVQQEGRTVFEKNGQRLLVEKNDAEAATMMSILIAGRLPKQEGEIAAEKWVLLNLGIEPEIGSTFDVTDADGGKVQTFTLTGILSDIYRNKKYGVLNLSASLPQNTSGIYTAYIQFGEHIKYESKVKQIRQEYGIRKKQLRECPAREHVQQAYLTDAALAGILLPICMVIFYGIYRITTQARLRQYGILRALGMQKRQMLEMILAELYQIYLVSVPIGILAGAAVVCLVMQVSGDRDETVYLYNEAVRFQLVFPAVPLAFCVIAFFLFLTVIGCLASKKAGKHTAAETISGNYENKTHQKVILNLQKAGSKFGTLLQMACKYIYRDFRTSAFLALTVCLGIILFTGLAYQAQLQQLYRENTKEMYYLNGQYAFTMLDFDRSDQGISRDSMKELQSIEQVTNVKTSSGIPIRVLDNLPIERNDMYYDEVNENMQKMYGYSNAGYDGTDQIYKSVLYGYNDRALEQLMPYIVEGTVRADSLRDDEIILGVLCTRDNKNSTAIWAKNGIPMMKYHAGDEISIKYREDLQTNHLEYEELSDFGAAYQYRTFKVAAIVSFPYMYDCKKTLYPILITKDQYVQEIAPDSHIQCVYLDGKGISSQKQQDALEQKLIRIGSRNGNVSTRSLIPEIRQNEMFYHKQMVYIWGISIVVFLLMLIQMVNNLKYRMQTRTREICMLRAVGMSVSMTRKIMMLENGMLGMAAVVLAFAASHPVLYYLYQVSEIKEYQDHFSYDYGAFLLVSAAAAVICVSLSLAIPGQWKSRRITEGMAVVD